MCLPSPFFLVYNENQAIADQHVICPLISDESLAEQRYRMQQSNLDLIFPKPVSASFFQKFETGEGGFFGDEPWKERMGVSQFKFGPPQGYDEEVVDEYEHLRVSWENQPEEEHDGFALEEGFKDKEKKGWGFGGPGFGTTANGNDTENSEEKEETKEKDEEEK